MRSRRISYYSHLLLLLLLWLMDQLELFHAGADARIHTLTPGTALKDFDYLESPNGWFRLKFFYFDDSDNHYFGIALRESAKGMVWVANRENPFSDTSGVVNITEDGNLLLSDGHGIRITLNSESPAMSSNTSAMLLDSGNFILKAGDQVVWQSFDYPSDTILPGMKLGLFAGLNSRKPRDHLLTSWKSTSVAAPGTFTLGVDPNNTNQLAIWRRGKLYWHSGNLNGHNFTYFPYYSSSMLKFSYTSNDNESYYTYSVAHNYALYFGISSDGEIFTTVDGNGGAVAGYLSCDAEEENGSNSKGCIDQKPSNKCSSGYQFISKYGYMDTWEDLYNSSLGLDDCKQMCTNNCSCKAYKSYYSDGTACRFSYDQDAHESEYGSRFYFRNTRIILNNNTSTIKNSTRIKEENPKKRRNLWVIIVAPLVSLIVVAAVFTLCYFQFLKDGSRGKRGSTMNSSTGTEVLIQELGTSMAAIDQLSGTNRLKLNGKHDHELPLFSFSSIETSTGYFSAANKLGQGGFGPVYKGTLADGKEIAVKRLSRKSGQGVEEFKNEVMLISNLQHRNLVRVLGCCIKGEEKILVYEYLPNKSLDSFLFDETKSVLLDWKRRAHIIEGIAQGLLYLHKYSRLRIIHRDLKTSNILLDANLNPKISDFGTAKIFGDNESGANTNRIVGTYGYMSPEYAMNGLFSEKSDVFSFGVLMLEILSGKKNTGFREPNVFASLLEYAWNLWREGRCSELMDQSVAATCNSTKEFIRYVEVALLCVQEFAEDRPTMTDIVSMLGSDLVTPPHPKQPAFSILRKVADTKMAENSGASTINNVSISGIEPR